MDGLADNALAFQTWERGLGSVWGLKQNDITGLGNSESILYYSLYAVNLPLICLAQVYCT